MKNHLPNVASKILTFLLFVLLVGVMFVSPFYIALSDLFEFMNR